ncbi:HET-domain-containing protein [Aaosphaeria arxii CBS 175.79]|uniref:HET-domain-containing protein n=1 Tax=Aaosphaeria arxii CBS 175.79 TaxID=1450172 RepID=A0A6A5XES0_9PLEO|nr:HET-domain-containing protein [Aaosphaeria arxii CBS 175.79]KAF2011336.1 HET-domain-containing protein [Aaosphaeria arxii CBS 175.79]
MCCSITLSSALHDYSSLAVCNSIPPYAILSHTWGADGIKKIQFCGEEAAKDGLGYFWVDTCCIDKSSSAELQEAINSMFQWYAKATQCYVYLEDVSTGGLAQSDLSSQQTWKLMFQKSRWFTRSWSLQELLAPKSVEFFSGEGLLLGNRISLMQEIHDTTGIAIEALQGSPLSNFSIAERFSWARKRTTKPAPDGDTEIYELEQRSRGI